MTYEWDDDKAEANKKKHDVDFSVAVKAFDDPFQVEYDDNTTRHELRFNVIGMVGGRLLVVTFTMRGDVCRIISARGAEPHEKRKYHEV